MFILFKKKSRKVSLVTKDEKKIMNSIFNEIIKKYPGKEISFVSRYPDDPNKRTIILDKDLCKFDLAVTCNEIACSKEVKVITVPHESYFAEVYAKNSKDPREPIGFIYKNLNYDEKHAQDFAFQNCS